MKHILYLVFSFCWIPLICQTTFVDVTESINTPSFNGAKTYGSGVSAIDVDEDGDIDLYILTEANSPNQLYLNDGTGQLSRFQNRLDISMRSRTSLWFDFDGDHLLDVIITGDCSFSNGSCLDEDNIKLFRQLGDRSFIDHTASSGILSGRNISGVFGGLAAGDINNDGFLDLVMTQWGGAGKLYMNNGNGTFTDITKESGLEKSARYWQPLVFDLDQDGLLDVYLTVDNNPNLFYKNEDGETFREIAVPIKLDNDHNDMGVALGDFDADQDFDLYVTNIERNRDGDHNVLLRNELQTGSLKFNEISGAHGVDAGGWGWGCSFMDANNDGFLDLAATNGWVTDFFDQSKFWMNTGSSFVDQSEQVGFNDTLQATSLVSFDLDRDGDLDLVQTLKENPDQMVGFRLLENKLNESLSFGNYLVVKPRMMGSNHWAIGSTVRITTSNSIQSRPITAGISFYGQEPAEAHFGLGELSEVEKVEIIWPGGAISSIEDITANQIITVTDADVLHAPGALRVTSQSSSLMELSWGHMKTSESSYVVERSQDLSFEDVVEFSVNSTENTFNDSGLDPYTEYFYRIRATDGLVFSNYSLVASTRTDSDVVILTPSDLHAEVKSLTSVLVNWSDEADNEEGYTIHRSLFEDFSSYVSFDLTANSATLLDESVEPHTMYYYRVQAYRNDGISDFSEVVSLNTTVLGTDNPESSFLIYPNPTTKYFQISPNDIEDTFKIQISDTYGKIMGEWLFESKETISNYRFEIPDTGMYFITIRYNDKTIVRKLITN